jgi:hypothetical protein
MNDAAQNTGGGQFAISRVMNTSVHEGNLFWQNFKLILQ